MIDPLIKILKRTVGDRAEILYNMDELKVSMDNIETTKKVHERVRTYSMAVGMVINSKKSAIQLSFETPLLESLQDIPRLDETTYKYAGFEMKKEVDRKEMMKSLEEMIKNILEEPTKRVEVFDSRN